MERAAPLEYEGQFSTEVYREQQPGLRRKFTLHNDQLIIEGRKRWRSEFEVPIPLRYIDTRYGVHRRRGDPGGPLAIVLGLIFACLLVFGWYDGLPQFFPIGAFFDAGLAAVCFATAIRHIRKTEFYVFRNLGGAFVFDIGRRGPDRERFDQFVASMLARVRSLQVTNTPPDNGSWIKLTP